MIGYVCETTDCKIVGNLIVTHGFDEFMEELNVPSGYQWMLIKENVGIDRSSYWCPWGLSSIGIPNWKFAYMRYIHYRMSLF